MKIIGIILLAAFFILVVLAPLILISASVTSAKISKKEDRRKWINE